MTKCKDCIHYGICSFHIDEETDLTTNECAHGFKHRDQYVMLPAYLGQIVYAADIHAEYYNGKIYYTCSGINEGKVSMLQQKADGSWKIRVSWYKYIQDSKEYSIGYLTDYTVDGFNKLCATKEAAEIKREEVVNQRLMEMNIK